MPKRKLAEPAYPQKRTFRATKRSKRKAGRKKRKKISGCACKTGKIGA